MDILAITYAPPTQFGVKASAPARFKFVDPGLQLDLFRMGLWPKEKAVEKRSPTPDGEKEGANGDSRSERLSGAPCAPERNP